MGVLMCGVHVHMCDKLIMVGSTLDKYYDKSCDSS